VLPKKQKSYKCCVTVSGYDRSTYTLPCTLNCNKAHEEKGNFLPVLETHQIDVCISHFILCFAKMSPFEAVLGFCSVFGWAPWAPWLTAEPREGMDRKGTVCSVAPHATQNSVWDSALGPVSLMTF
jgi:hypothetical protein